jgi:Ca2+-binding EF-hand superfamily protein
VRRRPREKPSLASKLVAAALIALDPGLVLAREIDPRQSEVQFEQFDRNGDGFLSRDEIVASAAIAARFEKFDLNKDGRLDQGEFRALLASLTSPDKKSP